MEAHPSGPHHKRKGSALDQMQVEAFNPGSGKAARPSEQEEPEQPEQAVDPRPLTETSQMHLNSLRASQEHVTQQIDAITAEGLEFLGRLRQGFLQRMDKVKQELGQLVVQVEDSLRAQSVNTLELRERCRMTSGLVERLGIKVEAREQECLFSAEEAGGGAGEEEGMEDGWEQDGAAAAVRRAAE